MILITLFIATFFAFFTGSVLVITGGSVSTKLSISETNASSTYWRLSFFILLNAPIVVGKSFDHVLPVIYTFP